MSMITFSAALLAFFIIETVPAVRKKKMNITALLFPAFFILAAVSRPMGFLAGGILILVTASDKLVEGGSALATRFGVPPLFIGIFIIGLGTSTPELFVNILSAVRGDTGLAMGNILGSNISNMGIVIGTAGLIAGGMKVGSGLIRKEIPIMLAASILLLLLVLDFAPFAEGRTAGVMILEMKDGMILLLGLVLYLLYTINSMKTAPPQAVPDQGGGVRNITPVYTSVLNILLGVAGLYFGGEFIINSSVSIAESLGAGTMTIGIIIGLGTSLPELATGIRCAVKKETDLVVGNVVGSNIFNILLILGLTSLIRPVFLSTEILMHFGFLTGISLLFYLSLGSKRRLNRAEAAALLLAGIGYLGISIITG